MAKVIARTLCRLHGTIGDYKKYYQRSEKLLRYPKMGKKLLSNCFGTTRWLTLGYDSEWPKYEEPWVIEKWFLDNYTLCDEERGCLVAFINQNIDFSDTYLFEHTGVYIPGSSQRIMLHQPDFGKFFELTTIDKYLKKNKGLEAEFYCPI